MNWIDLVDFIKQWGRLCLLSLLAATAQMYVSDKKFTFFHYFMAVIVALFAAYLAAALCDWQNLDTDLRTGVIGLTSYAAPHLLEGINKVIKLIVQDPKAFLTHFLKVK